MGGRTGVVALCDSSCSVTEVLCAMGGWWLCEQDMLAVGGSFIGCEGLGPTSAQVRNKHAHVRVTYVGIKYRVYVIFGSIVRAHNKSRDK